MPRTLNRYILKDVLKLLVTAALILTVVMSMGFSIKLISEGLIGPWALLKILFFTLPGMLTFALPFAATLAGTLVFFRLSQDNEITACLAGGVSYRQILMPLATLGLLLMAGLFVFSNWVVPHSWRFVESELQQDFVHMAVGQIQRGEVIEIKERGRGRIVIHADSASVEKPEGRPAEPGEVLPYQRLRIDGVAVGRMDDGENADELKDEHTARHAVIDLYRDPVEGDSLARLTLLHVATRDPQSGLLVMSDQLNIRHIQLPSLFRLQPQFMPLDQLQRFAQDPQRSPVVRENMAAIAVSLARSRSLEHVHGAMRDPARPLRLRGAQNEDFRITSPDSVIRGDRLRLRAGDAEPIVVKHYLGDLVVKTLTAREGWFEVSEGWLEAEPRLNLVLQGVTVLDRDLPTESNQAERVTLPLLRHDKEVVKPLMKMDIAAIREEAMQAVGPEGAPETEDSKALRRQVNILDRSVKLLERDILGRIHERSAIAVNCFLVLLLGGVMSMKLRHSVPLTIFFWCFMPTVVAFLTIHSGRGMVEWLSHPISRGISMLWSGNVLLLLIVVTVYWRLRRN